MTNEQLLPLIASILIPLGSLILVQSRAIRSELREAARERAALREHVDTQIGNLRDRMDNQIGDLRNHMDRQTGDHRVRMGRIEGSLDILRKFFIRDDRGTAA